MKFPKVSVITVCRNAVNQLELTIRNVAEQQYENLEFIVIDGVSTDGSLEVINRFHDRIDYCVSEWDSGIYDAMNKGVKAATGDWVIFMNAGDCFASADVLNKVFCRQEVADADVIYGDVIKEIGGNEVVKVAHRFKNSHRICFCHQSSLTRRRSLLKTPFDTSLKFSADFKFFKILGKRGCKFCYVNFPIAKFDTHGVSNTRRSDGLSENIQVVKSLDNIFYRFILLPRLYFVYFMCLLRGR